MVHSYSAYSNACPAFGGAEFNNCLISYNNNYPFMGAYSNPATYPGMDNVKLNNVTVVHPSTTNAFYSENVNAITNSALTAQVFTTIPASNITYTADTAIKECPLTNSVLNVRRPAGSNITYPLALSYTITGSPFQGFDYSRMNGFAILPTGSNNTADSIFAIRNKILSPQKEAIITTNASIHYNTVSSAQSLLIYDCNLDTPSYTVPNNIAEGFKIYPNPVKAGLINISTKVITGKISVVITDMMGRQVLTQSLKKPDFQSIKLLKQYLKGCT